MFGKIVLKKISTDPDVPSHGVVKESIEDHHDKSTAKPKSSSITVNPNKYREDNLGGSTTVHKPKMFARTDKKFEEARSDVTVTRVQVRDAHPTTAPVNWKRSVKDDVQTRVDLRDLSRSFSSDRIMTKKIVEPKPAVKPRFESLDHSRKRPSQPLMRGDYKIIKMTRKVQEVFVEACNSDDETYQMQPWIQRKLEALGRSPMKAKEDDLLIEECSGSGYESDDVDDMESQSSKELTLVSDSEEEESKFIPTVYPCLHCKEKFNCKKSFKTHQCVEGFTPKDQGMFTCNECGEKFHSKGHLMNHMHSHETKHRRKFTCRFCGIVFKQRRDQYSHEKTYHPEKNRLKCEHCDETFLTRAHRSKHEKDMLHGMWHAIIKPGKDSTPK